MPEPSAEGVRLATANLLHGMRLGTGSCEADDLVEAGRLLDSDVVGLQEVDRRQDRSGGVDQTALLAEALGAMWWRFVPAVHGTPGEAWVPATGTEAGESDGPTYGVALLSRWPVRRWWVRRFDAAPVALPLLVPQSPRPRVMRVGDEPRVAVAALVDGPAGPFTAVTCHLSFVPGVNVRQLRAITRWAESLAPPVVLLGDLNLPGRLPALLTRWPSLARTATYPSYAPRVQFDHVLGLGLDPSVVADAAASAQAVRLPVSDHCALTVTVPLATP